MVACTGDPVVASSHWRSWRRPWKAGFSSDHCGSTMRVSLIDIAVVELATKHQTPDAVMRIVDIIYRGAISDCSWEDIYKYVKLTYMTITTFPALSSTFCDWATKIQDAAMNMAEASLFIVPANGRTNRDIGLGIPYWSQAMKAFGRHTTLQQGNKYGFRSIFKCPDVNKQLTRLLWRKRWSRMAKRTSSSWMDSCR